MIIQKPNKKVKVKCFIKKKDETLISHILSTVELHGDDKRIGIVFDEDIEQHVWVFWITEESHEWKHAEDMFGIKNYSTPPITSELVDNLVVIEYLEKFNLDIICKNLEKLNDELHNFEKYDIIKDHDK
jgi:hypothetical protein